MIQALLIILSISSMFALGLKIDKKELEKLQNLIPLLFGLTIYNFILIPILSIILIKIFNLNFEISVGLFLCAASPGGASAGIFVLRAKGNPNIAGLMIILLNILSIFFTPLIFAIFLGSEIQLGLEILNKLLMVSFLLQGLPILLGYLFKKFANKASEIVLPFISFISISSLILSILLLAIKHYNDFLKLELKVWIVSFILIILSLVSGLIFRLVNYSIQSSISIVSSIRSLSLALILTEVQSKNSISLLTILLYGAIMYLITELSTRFWKIKVEKDLI